MKHDIKEKGSKMECEINDALKAYIAGLDKEIQQAYDELPKSAQKYNIRYLFIKYFLFPLICPYLWITDKDGIKEIRMLIRQEQLLIEINYHKRKSLIERIKVYEKQKEYTLLRHKIK